MERILIPWLKPRPPRSASYQVRGLSAHAGEQRWIDRTAAATGRRIDTATDGSSDAPERRPLPDPARAARLGIVIATDQIVPATSAHQAQLRVWLAARATGIVCYLLLVGQVVFGLILSHPTNQTTWKLSKRLFPWHENLWIFVLAFLAAHIVSLLLDPFAGVGVAGNFIPGLSGYRSSAVALGTLAMYALIVTGLTARYTKLLPRASG